MFTYVTQAILLVGAIATSTVASAADEWQVRSSPYSVPETVTRLTAAIEGAGARIAAVMDHAEAVEADLDLEPTTVVIFEDPGIRPPGDAGEERIGLELPLRILVWQDGDSTMIGYVEPGAPSSRDEGALRRLTDSAIT